MPLQLLFLGSGTSAGVPMIGCDCDVCRSDDRRDHRTRPSVLISYGDADKPEMRRQLLVDASPDIRMQAVRNGINRIDGLMLTHCHADHIFGLDDLRRFNAVMNEPIIVRAEQAVHEVLRKMFGYIFEKHKNVNQTFIADLILDPITVADPIDLFGATWTPLRLMHGRQPVLGFRVDHAGRSLAYCTDVSSIVPESYPLLEGLDVLVLDALRYRHHPTHMTVDQAIEQIEQIKPRQAYLTHIAHDISHADLESKLPDNIHLGYDGLRVSCEPADENGCVKIRNHDTMITL